MSKLKAALVKKSVGKSLKKACKKQAKKWCKQQLKQAPKKTKVLKKSLKHNRKLLVSTLTNSVLGELLAGKVSDKKSLKARLNSLASEYAANDNQVMAPVTRMRPAPQQPAQHFAMKPLKSKPCSGCPALKGSLCKCALKVEARKLRQQKAG